MSKSLENYCKKFIFNPNMENGEDEKEVFPKIHGEVPFLNVAFESSISSDNNKTIELDSNSLLIRVLFCHGSSTDIVRVREKLQFICCTLTVLAKTAFPSLHYVRVIGMCPAYPSYPYYRYYPKRPEELDQNDITNWAFKVSTYFHTWECADYIYDVFIGQSIGCGWLTNVLQHYHTFSGPNIIHRSILLYGCFPSIRSILVNQGFFVGNILNAFLPKQDLFQVDDILEELFKSNRYFIIISNSSDDEVFKDTFEDELGSLCHKFLLFDETHDSLLGNYLIIKDTLALAFQNAGPSICIIPPYVEEDTSGPDARDCQLPITRPERTKEALT